MEEAPYGPITVAVRWSNRSFRNSNQALAQLEAFAITVRSEAINEVASRHIDRFATSRLAQAWQHAVDAAWSRIGRSSVAEAIR